MTGYKIFHCPYCEVVARVIWPDPQNISAHKARLE